MDLKKILRNPNRNLKGPSWYSQNTISVGNSSSVSKYIETLPIKTLALVRSIHLELTITHSTEINQENFLLDNVNSAIDILTGPPQSYKRFDRNMELGFDNQNRMEGLFKIMKWSAAEKVSDAEFSALYEEWARSYNRGDLVSSQSNPQIDEDFRKTLATNLEKMMLCITNEYNKHALEGRIGYSSDGTPIAPITVAWLQCAEEIFSLLDEDERGHTDAEGIQWLLLALIGPEEMSLNPSQLRQRTFSQLQDMKHTNGLVSLRCFKNYLLYQGLNEEEDLSNMKSRLQNVAQIWKEIRSGIMTATTPSLAHCTFLGSSSAYFPSIWYQAIIMSVESTIPNWEALVKYLQYSGYLLASTPTVNTKGQRYIEGTYIRDITELTFYLLVNYQQQEGQYNTQTSITNIDENNISRAMSDPRFSIIRKMLRTYDEIMNLIITQIHAALQGSSSSALPTERQELTLTNTFDLSETQEAPIQIAPHSTKQLQTQFDRPGAAPMLKSSASVAQTPPVRMRTKPGKPASPVSAVNSTSTPNLASPLKRDVAKSKTTLRRNMSNKNPIGGYGRLIRSTTPSQVSVGIKANKRYEAAETRKLQRSTTPSKASIGRMPGRSTSPVPSKSPNTSRTTQRPRNATPDKIQSAPKRQLPTPQKRTMTPPPRSFRQSPTGASYDAVLSNLLNNRGKAKNFK